MSTVGMKLNFYSSEKTWYQKPKINDTIGVIPAILDCLYWLTSHQRAYIPFLQNTFKLISQELHPFNKRYRYIQLSSVQQVEDEINDS